MLPDHSIFCAHHFDFVRIIVKFASVRSKQLIHNTRICHEVGPETDSQRFDLHRRPRRISFLGLLDEITSQRQHGRAQTQSVNMQHAAHNARIETAFDRQCHDPRRSHSVSAVDEILTTTRRGCRHLIPRVNTKIRIVDSHEALSGVSSSDDDSLAIIHRQRLSRQSSKVGLQHVVAPP